VEQVSEFETDRDAQTRDDRPPPRSHEIRAEGLGAGLLFAAVDCRSDLRREIAGANLYEPARREHAPGVEALGVEFAEHRRIPRHDPLGGRRVAAPESVRDLDRYAHERRAVAVSADDVAAALELETERRREGRARGVRRACVVDIG